MTDAALRSLLRSWEQSQNPEDLERYAVAIIRSGQAEPMIQLLLRLDPSTKSRLLQFLGEDVWREVVNAYYQTTGILYGFLFVSPKILEEASYLLGIADLEEWEEEFGDNLIEMNFDELGPPERDEICVSFSYSFIEKYHAEISLLSGGSNYWVSAELWRSDRPITALDAGEQLEGSYPFESIRLGKERLFELEILPEV
jgi:hypothetical protein